MADARSLSGSFFSSCSTNSGGSSPAPASVVVVVDDEEALVVVGREEVVAVKEIVTLVGNCAVVVAGKIFNKFCSPSSFRNLPAEKNTFILTLW